MAPTSVNYNMRTKTTESTRAAAAVATIAAYPDYTGTYSGIVGTIAVQESSTGITLTGTVTGVEASATGGIHIHSGVTCATTDDPGGHYYDGMTSDPWTTT